MKVKEILCGYGVLVFLMFGARISLAGVDASIETETKCIKWQGAECLEDETTYKVGGLSCTENCVYDFFDPDKCIVKNTCTYQPEINCFIKMVCQVPNVFGSGCLHWDEIKVCK